MAEFEQFCMYYVLDVVFWDLRIFVLLLTHSFFSTPSHHITASAASVSVFDTGVFLWFCFSLSPHS